MERGTDKAVQIPEFPNLVFDDRQHRYLLDGVEIPSVTTLLKPLTEEDYRTIPEATLARAADRGTAVHTAIEIYIKTGFVDIQNEYRGYMDSFLSWYEEAKPEIVGSEVRTYHKAMRYAGTLDLICIVDGELTLIDYKTSRTVYKKTCAVQLTGYSKALASHGVFVEKQKILHLKPDGFALHDFPVTDGESWRVLGACRTLYGYKFCK